MRSDICHTTNLFQMINQIVVHTQAGPVHGQLQEQQVSLSNSGLLPKFSKVKFYTILCLLSIVFLRTQGRSLMRNSDFPDSPLIKINDVAGLFNLKEGSKVSLTIFDSKFKGYTLSGVVKNHSNMGSNSGVLNIALVGSGVEYKLLVTRKILYNNLVYKIKLIDKKTNTWYTQDSSDKEYYTLSAKAQKHIVTE